MRRVCGLAAGERLHIELTSSRLNREEIFFVLLTSVRLSQELNGLLRGDRRWREGGGDPPSLPHSHLSLEAMQGHKRLK